MTDRSVYRAGPDAGRGPLCVYLCMYGMWYCGELTKLCAYGFQFMFQVLPSSNGKARDNSRTHITSFSHFLDLL